MGQHLIGNLWAERELHTHRVFCSVRRGDLNRRERSNLQVQVGGGGGASGEQAQATARRGRHFNSGGVQQDEMGPLIPSREIPT